MKNLVRDLLLAFKFFVHFCEGSSSIIRRGSQPLPSYDEDHLFIPYNRGGTIVAIRKRFGENYLPHRCVLLESSFGYTPRGIPTLENKENEKFATYPLFVNGTQYCVVYVTEAGEVLGAKAPPTDQDASPLRFNGDPSHLSPNSTTYYVTERGFHFAVNHLPHQAMVPTRVTLFPKNQKQFSYVQVTTFAIMPEKIQFTGLTFYGICRTRDTRTTREKIVYIAAYLDYEDIPSVITSNLFRFIKKEQTGSTSAQNAGS